MQKIKILFFIIITFIFLSPQNFHAIELNECIIITVPKSGTHLLNKYFYRLLFQKIIPHKIWRTTHFYITTYNNFYNLYNANPSKRIISLIRDPRDIICSLIDWLEKAKNYAYIYVNFKQNWYQLSRSEKICIFLDVTASKTELDKFIEYNCQGMTLPQKIKETIERAILFNKIPHVLIVRFEDIVGSKGRGSDCKQQQSFSSINNYLNIIIDNDQLLEILDSLWGNEHNEGITHTTFFKGYIGRWKEEFDETAIAYMKKHYNNILIELGYESNNNWEE